MEVDFEYEHETDSGEPITLYVHMEFDWSLEKNYGADADGNRGKDAWFMEPEPIHITNKDGLDITEIIRAAEPNLYKKLETMAMAEAEITDPEESRYDYDE